MNCGIRRQAHRGLLVWAAVLASSLAEPLAALQDPVPATGNGSLPARAKALGAAMPVGNGMETGSDPQGFGDLSACSVRLPAGHKAGRLHADPDSCRSRLLGVNLDRIKRRMAALAPYGQGLLLRRTEFVNVYAPALRVEILGDFNVESWVSSLGGRTGGAIAYGSPTHNEMMKAMVPAFWQQQAHSTGGFSFGW